MLSQMKTKGKRVFKDVLSVVVCSRMSRPVLGLKLELHYPFLESSRPLDAASVSANAVHLTKTVGVVTPFLVL